jgi:hypothetical protein
MAIICNGYISDSGRWMIEARLFYNDIFRPEFVSFIIDSGADISMLSPTHAMNLKIDIESLPRRRKNVSGLGGGECKVRKLYAKFAFPISFDGRMSYLFEDCYELLIGEKDGKCWESIIGQDILKRFNLKANVKNHEIILVRQTIVKPPYIIPIY